jgi:hypothetical protein
MSTFQCERGEAHLASISCGFISDFKKMIESGPSAEEDKREDGIDR